MKTCAVPQTNMAIISGNAREMDELSAWIAWKEIRLRHAVGGPGEQQYREAHRAASDRLWQRIHHL
jgi:hypothetical protein